MLVEKYLRCLLQYGFAAKDGYPHISRYKREAKAYIRSFPKQNEALLMLKKIITHAYLTTRYYKKEFDENNICPDDFKDIDALTQLPFMTKDILQKEKDNMVSEGFRNNVEISHTGGSSGNPTAFYRDRKCTAIRNGRQLGILEECGYETGERCGLLWGAHLDLDLQKKTGLRSKFRQFASGKKTLPCTILEEEGMIAFHRDLQMFKPKILYGYPNAMTEFAQFVQDQNLEPIHVEKIFCTAETLFPHQRRILSNVFEGEVFNLYCTREHGCIGFECDRHDGFHIDTGSVYVEIISSGKKISEEKGEIVITDLLNYGMPLLRSKIGDVGSLSTEFCDCGCALPKLQSFSGRVTDQLYRSDGKIVSGLMLLDMVSDVPEVKWFQVIQHSFTDFDFLLVADDGYGANIEEKIYREMKGFLGENISVNIKIVPEIKRNQNSGKYQEVICKMKL